VAAGAALLSVAAPLVREFALADAAAAALFVGALSVCNGAGRVFWGAVSDGATVGPVLIASLPYRTALLVIAAGAAAAAVLPLLAWATMARKDAAVLPTVGGLGHAPLARPTR
jgi:OFA family oxalate/formate antiporter-like MFS transporter